MKKEDFITERTKIISEMLDNPDKYGIYPTTKCFEKLDNLYDRLTDKMAASEAIFGFCGWLTTRKEKTVMSSKHDSAVIADLIKQFCDVNKLAEPKGDWADLLLHPKSE